MLNCFKYDPQYETILRESLQENLDKRERERDYHPDSYYKYDSVVLKDTYPNSAVVTVNYSYIDPKDNSSNYSDSYDLNLVKDSANWKLEVRFSYTITSD